MNAPISRLLEIMAQLRSEGGCPWDAKQTPKTLVPFIIEEAYEVIDAIDAGEPERICEELGDLLLQVVFQARIFEERGQFDFDDVACAIAEKLLRRHPHVFAGASITSEEELRRNWEEIKAKEKARKKGSSPAIPRHLPALMRAQKLAAASEHLGDCPSAEELRGSLAALLDLPAEADNGAKEALLSAHLMELCRFAEAHRLDAEGSLRKRTFDAETDKPQPSA